MSLSTYFKSSTTKIIKPQTLSLFIHRLLSFASLDEAAAERRRRKRQLRMEPPLHSLRQSPSPSRPPPNDSNINHLLPDSTARLVGLRLSLHNRIRSLIRSGKVDLARERAQEAMRVGKVRPTVFTCNAVMQACLEEGRVDEVDTLFGFFVRQMGVLPNVVSYNVLIKAHCDAGRVDTALNIYREILDNAPFTPSAVTYRYLTNGLVHANRIQDAMDLLREMHHRGHASDSLVYNILMQGFINIGNMDKAYELFYELKEQCTVYDGIVHITFMEAYWKQGKDKEAMENYQSLLDENFDLSPTTVNALLTTLLKHNKKKEANRLFQIVIGKHNHPILVALDSETYNIMVNKKFEDGKLDEAIEVFHTVGRKPLKKSVGCYNNIIGKLFKHGLNSEAERLFNEMPENSVYPDAASYELMVDACFSQGEVDDALKYFYQMLNTDDEGYSSVKVNTDFYNKMFNNLVRLGYVSQAMDIFQVMKEKEMKPEIREEHKPVPDAFTFETLVTGLCKVSNYDRARDVVEEMLRRKIVISSQFYEFVIESFQSFGRVEEINKLFHRHAGNDFASQAQQVLA